MYAAIRRYRIDPDLSAVVIRQIIESFVPIIREVPGLFAYYVLDAGDGVFATVSIFESRAGVETSNRRAAEWIKQYLAETVFSQEEVPSFFIEVGEALQGTLYQGVTPEHLSGQGVQQLLSVEEICEALGVSKRWVHQRIRSGALPSVKLEGSTRVRSAALEEYLKNRLYQVEPTRSSNLRERGN